MVNTKENKLLTEELGNALALYINDFLTLQSIRDFKKETQSVWHLLGDSQLTHKT